MNAVAQFRTEQVPSTALLLAQARAAYRDKLSAESKLAHLRRYAGQSPAMKDEAAKACARLREAEATLQRVLGGAA